MRHSRVLVLALAITSRADAQADRWKLVGITDDTTYYIDSVAIVTADNKFIEVWTRSVFAKTIVVRDGGNHDSRTERHRIDCTKLMWRGIESVNYRGAELVRRNTGSTRASLYAPKWPMDQVLLERACKMAGR